MEANDRTPPNNSASNADRRVWVRYDCTFDSQCQALLTGLGERWPATVTDVSQSGVRLSVGRRFEAGAILRVELPPGDAGPPCSAIARVVHVKGSDTSWYVGCEFVSKPDGEAIVALATSERPLSET